MTMIRRWNNDDDNDNDNDKDDVDNNVYDNHKGDDAYSDKGLL